MHSIPIIPIIPIICKKEAAFLTVFSLASKTSLTYSYSRLYLIKEDRGLCLFATGKLKLKLKLKLKQLG